MKKKIYSGRHSYYYFSLSQKLTDKGCDKGCELCYYNNKNKCITCILDDFEISQEYKKWKEIATTLLETTIPNKIETTIPKIIVSTIPKIIEPTIQNAIETNIQNVIETTILKEIKTTIIDTIKITNPEIRETTKPINIEDKNCTVKYIIEGTCIEELTDEDAGDIYYYIKVEL